MKSNDVGNVYLIWVIHHSDSGTYMNFDANAALSDNVYKYLYYAGTTTAGRDKIVNLLLGERSGHILSGPGNSELADGLYTVFIANGSFQATLSAIYGCWPDYSEIEQKGWIDAIRDTASDLVSCNLGLETTLKRIAAIATQVNRIKLSAQVLDNTQIVSAVDEVLLYAMSIEAVDDGLSNWQEMMERDYEIVEAIWSNFANNVEAAKGDDGYLGWLLEPAGIVLDPLFTLFFPIEEARYAGGLFLSTAYNLSLFTYKSIVRPSELYHQDFAMLNGLPVTVAEYMQDKGVSYDNNIQVNFNLSNNPKSVTGYFTAMSTEVGGDATRNSDKNITWSVLGQTKTQPMSQPLEFEFTSSGIHRVEALANGSTTPVILSVEVEVPPAPLAYDIEWERSDVINGRVFFKLKSFNVPISDIETVVFKFGDDSAQQTLGGTSPFPVPQLPEIRWAHDYPVSTNPNSFKAKFAVMLKDGRATLKKRSVVIMPTPAEPVITPPSAARHYPGRSTRISQGESVSFRITAVDEDEDMTRFEWTIDGNIEYTIDLPLDEGLSASSNKVFTFNSPGEYDVVARVFDDQGHTDQIVWTINVEASTTPEIVAQSPDYTDPSDPIGVIGVSAALAELVVFSVSVQDAEDNIDTVNWMINNELIEIDKVGTNPSTETWSHRFNEVGTYRVTTKVKDDLGKENYIDWNVVVGGDDPSNHLPTAEIIQNPHDNSLPRTYRVGYKYHFHYMGYDVDGNLAYGEVRLNGQNDWGGPTDFSDNLSGYEERAGISDLVFTTLGDHIISFTVRDGNGAEVTETLTVSVVSRDAAASTEPSIYSIFPDPSRNYYYTLGQSGVRFDYEGVVFDAEGDLRYIDGTYGGARGLSNWTTDSFTSWFDLDDQGFSPGVHYLDFVPVDTAGNKGTAVRYTINVSLGTYNYAPIVARMKPS